MKKPHRIEYAPSNYVKIACSLRAEKKMSYTNISAMGLLSVMHFNGPTAIKDCHIQMTGSSVLHACYSWNHSTVRTNLFRPSYNLPNTSGYNSDATGRVPY